MRIKKIIALLIGLLLCVSLCACKSNKKTSSTDISSVSSGIENNIASNINPLLYKVSDNNGNIIWLFGSIHVGREDYFPLPKYVNDAFNSSDRLAVEIDIVDFEKNIGLQMSAMSKLIYSDGTTIKDHISQELYEKGVGILEDNNQYLEAIDYYCPSLWGSMIETLMVTELGGDVNLGIDRHLINLAKEKEKEIVEIESAEFQYKMLADFDDDVQIMLLESAIQSYENKDEASADLKKLMDLWALGDETAFAEYINSSDDMITEQEKTIYNKYYKAMFTDRNVSMADFAEKSLSSGKEVFICVGAAHIVGEDAVADLLEQKGYKVELIIK